MVYQQKKKERPKEKKKLCVILTGYVHFGSLSFANFRVRVKDTRRRGEFRFFLREQKSQQMSNVQFKLVNFRSVHRIPFTIEFGPNFMDWNCDFVTPYNVGLMFVFICNAQRT